MLADRPRRATAKSEWDQKEMPFTEHLRELRKRLIVCVDHDPVIGIGMFYAVDLRHQLDEARVFSATSRSTRSGRPTRSGRSSSSRSTARSCIGLPVICIRSGCSSFRRSIRRRAGRSTIRRAVDRAGRVGIVFAHFLVIPRVIGGRRSITSSIATATFGIESTINLVLLLFLAFALIFQTPMIMIMLARIGLVNSKSLRTFRRYAIMGSLLAGGIARARRPADHDDADGRADVRALRSSASGSSSCWKSRGSARAHT